MAAPNENLLKITIDTFEKRKPVKTRIPDAPICCGRPAAPAYDHGSAVSFRCSVCKIMIFDWKDEPFPIYPTTTIGQAQKVQAALCDLGEEVKKFYAPPIRQILNFILRFTRTKR